MLVGLILVMNAWKSRVLNTRRRAAGVPCRARRRMGAGERVWRGVPALLVLLVLAPAMAVAQQEVISSDFTQDGGTFELPDDTTLLVTDPDNDPTLSLINGASAEWGGNSIVVLGAGEDESGNLELLGGSSMNFGSTFVVGFRGTGEALIAGGSSLSTDGPVHLAAQTGGSEGTLTVSGEGSTLTSGGDLSIAHRWEGTGSLRIEDGAVVSTGGHGTVGRNFTGTAVVTGQDSTWSIAGELRMGNFADGDLTIADGGTVVSSGGRFSYVQGDTSLIVSGEGSSWTSQQGDVDIGMGRNAEVMISDGASVDIDTVPGLAEEVRIAHDSGTTSKVTVTGQDSTLTVNAFNMEVGRDGTGEMTITDGAKVDVTGDLFISFPRNSESPAPRGRIEVSGQGSELSGEELIVGKAAVGDSRRDGTLGELFVKNGGQVSVSEVRVGRLMGSRGRIFVNGEGSTLTNSGPMRVGWDDRGRMRVTDGGGVFSASGEIGGGRNDNDSLGWVTVAGAGSIWEIDGDLVMGGSLDLMTETNGDGTLSIHGGGEVKVGQSMRLWEGSLAEVEVLPGHGGGSGASPALSIDGDLTNHGLIRLLAAAEASQGVYVPVGVDGDWTGTGMVQTIGGTWDETNLDFHIAPSAIGTDGASSSLNLTVNQRLKITGGSRGELLAAFDSAGEASGGGQTIDFTATELSISTLGNEEVLGAWEFDTDLLSGTEVQLSMEVGEGWDPNLFSAWYNPDGVEWVEFETTIRYDGLHASFMVDSFSGYAISAIPEPSSVLLVLLAMLMALGGRGRCCGRLTSAV